MRDDVVSSACQGLKERVAYHALPGLGMRRDVPHMSSSFLTDSCQFTDAVGLPS